MSPAGAKAVASSVEHVNRNSTQEDEKPEYGISARKILSTFLLEVKVTPGEVS